MSLRRTVVIAGLALLVAGVPLAAHHATRAAFDDSKIVTLSGVVTEVKLTNPHGSFDLDVKDAVGNSVSWHVELSSAIGLLRQGWRKGDLKPGDEVTLDVWVSKTRSHYSNARIVRLPDGRSISGATGWDCASATQQGCSGPGRMTPPTK